DYQVYIRGNKTIDLHTLYAQSIGDAFPYHFLPDNFAELTGQLTGYPLYEIVETIIRVFNLKNLSGEFAYMQAFQDVILEYGQKERADIASFLEWWGQQGATKA